MMFELVLSPAFSLDLSGEKSMLDKESPLVRLGRKGIGVDGLELRNWFYISNLLRFMAHKYSLMMRRTTKQ